MWVNEYGNTWILLSMTTHYLIIYLHYFALANTFLKCLPFGPSSVDLGMTWKSQKESVRDTVTLDVARKEVQDIKVI